MGIQHIEDLQPDAFINFVQNLHLCTITEKLDGTNIVVGRDITGEWYTSRSSKGDDHRFYHPDDYDPTFAVNHPYRLIQAATYAFGDYEHNIVKPGQAVECEILFDRQPNAIVYGGNHLVFLNPSKCSNVPYDSTEWESLIQQKPVNEYGYVVDSHRIQLNPSHQIDVIETKRRLHVSTVPHLKSSRFKLTNEAEKIVDDYQNWLSRGTVGSALTNEELIKVNLTSIPKADRAGVKAARENARSKSLEYKLNIKSFLIDVLAETKPSLRPDDLILSPSEDFGIEGVVATSTDGVVVKIVNKKLFTTINAFNHIVRNKIRKTSHGTVPNDVDCGVDFNVKAGSLYDHMLSQLSDVHGIDGLNTYMSIKRGIRKHITDGKLPTTVDNMSKLWGMHRSVVLRTPVAVRGIVIMILRQHLAILQNSRQLYLTHSPSYYLRLDQSSGWGGNNQRVVGYNSTIHHRTMVVFAEVEAEIQHMIENIRFAEDLQTIITCLFKKQLLSVH